MQAAQRRNSNGESDQALLCVSMLSALLPAEETLWSLLSVDYRIVRGAVGGQSSHKEPRSSKHFICSMANAFSRYCWCLLQAWSEQLSIALVHCHWQATEVCHGKHWVCSRFIHEHLMVASSSLWLLVVARLNEIRFESQSGSEHEHWEYKNF